MNKEVLYGKESRAKMLKGIQAITNAVKVTMGAMGKCVLIGEIAYHEGWQVPLPTKVSKDGYTVAKHFELQDSVENRGAMMIKEAATKTVEQAGDATTATCVLAESLITNGIKMIDEDKANSQQLKKGMDLALSEVLDGLKELSTPVKGNIDRIRQIATVSANNDSSIGNLIADAFAKIGDEGVLNIEASQGTQTEIKLTDGYKFERGWISPLFVTNRSKETCEFDNPLILLYQNKVTHHTQIQRAVDISMHQQRPLLIIAEDCDEEGLAYLAINNHRKSIVVCAVKAPEFGDLRREAMEDIALLTGGTYISDIRGIDIKEDLEFKHFGQAKKVIISKTETIIIGGNRDESKFDEFIADLKMNLAQAKTENDKAPIEKRIAQLNSSVAVIQVGAATETELNEKMDRVDDAVRATKAAISEGFVAGGGTAFLRIKIKNDGTDEPGIEMGKQLVRQALSAPLFQICENAGVNADKIYTQVKGETGNIGYNALTDKVVDMVDAGIIDSTKALRCALTNAVSVAGMVLTSECSIITIS